MADDTSRRYIDLHSHLIPGVDDGCGRIDETLACIGRLQTAGFVGSVCTPHVWPDLYPANTLGAVRGRVEELRGELLRAGVDYQLWPGGEVRIAPATSGWLARQGVPTLGPSRYVLIDYWGGNWPPFADELVDWLLDREYVPMLAHPERMGLDDAQLTRIVESLARRGVLLQGNLRSLAGGEGPQARAQLQGLLQQGQVYALATDTHGAADVDGRLAGLKVLDELLGPEASEKMLGMRPSEIVGVQWAREQ